MAETMTFPSSAPRGGAWYVLAWALLGLAAALYLAALTASPESMPSWLTRRSLSPPQDNQGQRATAELAGATGAELARLRSEVAAREAQIKTLQLRVAGLEQDLADARQRVAAVTDAPGTNTGSTTTAPTTTGGLQTDRKAGIEIVNASPVGIDGSPLASASAAVTEPPLPVRRPDLPVPLRQSLGVPAGVSAIETGSLAVQSGAAAVAAAAVKPKPEALSASAVTFGAAEVKPAAPEPGIGVRLATGPSVDALRLSWSLMTERYAAELGGLEPRYVAGGSPSAPYALIAGPVADQAAARALCAGLLAKGLPCVTDSFTGNAL